MENETLKKVQSLFSQLGYSNQLGVTETSGSKLISAREGDWFVPLVKYAKARNILEWGTWQGRSALSWTEALKKNLIPPSESCVVCVDTWLGSWEHIIDLNSKSEWSRSNLHLVNGRPEFFRIFLEEISRHGASEYIYPFSGTTETAYQVFKRLDIMFDLIYIDASHDYLPVTRDLVMARDLLSPSGVIVGDDFDTWESVKAAVLDFACEADLQLITGAGQYLLIPDIENSDLISELIKIGWTLVPRRNNFKKNQNPSEHDAAIRFMLSQTEEELRLLQREHKLILQSRIWTLAGYYSRFKKRFFR